MFSLATDQTLFIRIRSSRSINPKPQSILKVIRIKKSAIGSAPGVFDFLGGIASQSGCLALQSQTQSKTTVLATEGSDSSLCVTSAELGRFETPIDSFKDLIRKGASHQQFADWLEECESPGWSRNALACLALFSTRFQWLPESGLSLAINTDIGANQGIGRAISFQVATLRALEKLTKHYFADQGLALLAQEASEKILGKVCSSFIPAASAYGRPGCLSPLHEGEIKPNPPIELPKGVTIVGTPCRLDNSEMASKRNIALSAIGIGKVLAQNAANKDVDRITSLSLSKYIQSIEETLPISIDGKSFLERFTSRETSSIDIKDDTQYPVQQAFGYAVAENYRSGLASHILTNLAHNSKRQAVTLLGELMLQSHASYSRLGLSDSRVDELIGKIRDQGSDQGLFGGRVTGTARSSVIVFLIDKKSAKRLRDLVKAIFGPKQTLTL